MSLQELFHGISAEDFDAWNALKMTNYLLGNLILRTLNNRIYCIVVWIN